MLEEIKTCLNCGVVYNSVYVKRKANGYYKDTIQCPLCKKWQECD